MRVDTGVVEGSEISMFYDPMIAKLVTHGPDRARPSPPCRRRSTPTRSSGINHNIAFLAAVMAHERFRAGRLTTNFIAEEFPEGFQGHAAARTRRRPPGGRRRRAAEPRRPARCLGTAIQPSLAHARRRLGGGRTGRHAATRSHSSKTANGTWVEVDGEAGRRDPGPGRLAAGSERSWRRGSTARPLTVQIERRGPWWSLSHGGAQLDVLVLTTRGPPTMPSACRRRRRPISPASCSRPCRACWSRSPSNRARTVKAGEELAVVEAMKMENVLRAERDGTVSKIHADPGASLAVDQVILEFE